MAADKLLAEIQRRIDKVYAMYLRDLKEAEAELVRDIERHRRRADELGEQATNEPDDVVAVGLHHQSSMQEEAARAATLQLANVSVMLRLAKDAASYATN